MKTIFDRTVREEVIRRIGSLDAMNTAQWGKMNLAQMLTHCVRYEELMLQGRNQKQTLLGRIFGQRVLKDFLQDESPIKRNLPTLPQLKVKESGGDVPALKVPWPRVQSLTQSRAHCVRSGPCQSRAIPVEVPTRLKVRLAVRLGSVSKPAWVCFENTCMRPAFLTKD